MDYGLERLTGIEEISTDGELDMKALIVDKSNTMRRIMCNILRDIGFHEFREAKDGFEAVSMANDESFHLMLMDWDIPVMSGIEALTEIRAMGNTPQIVMVSTVADRSRVLEALKAGANNYIIKPFNSEKVAEKIQLLI